MKKHLNREMTQKVNDIQKMKNIGRNYVFLPKELTKDLLYLVGVIVGDGSLPVKYNGYGQRNYKIAIQMKNHGYLKIIGSMFEDLFKIKPKYCIQKKEDREYLEMFIYSKSLYKYLSSVFDLPEGKKSKIVRMPEIIRKLNPVQRLPFIAGVFDTDWGVSASGFGTHCASKKLIEDVVNTMTQISDIRFSAIKSYVQRDKYRSYQIRLSKKDFSKLYKVFNINYPLKNMDKINYLCRGGGAATRQTNG